MGSNSFDIVIVGAGFAGACTAHAVSGRGSSVLLIERRFEYPDILRAEKLEPDQARMMRELGLLALRAPTAPPVGTILNFEEGRCTEFDTEEQYGISYGDTVNRLVEAIPQSVHRLEGRARGFSTAGGRPEVLLENGTSVTAQVIVLATGGSDRLISSLGIERRRDPSLRSLSFGFDLEIDDEDLPGYRGFNYYLPPNDAQIDYLTVFPIGRRVRVNLFTRMEPKDPLVQSFKTGMTRALEEYFPTLREHIGGYRISTAVQAVPTSFSRLRNAPRRGVVVIGEEFQTVSPTTGTGLSRVLTDVQVLTERHLPRWLRNGRASRHHVRSYYRDPRKVAEDRRALDSWIHYRDRGCSGSIPLARRLRDRLRLLRIGRD